jgi:hypothetical protein
MTTIKECRVIEIFENDGQVYLKRCSPYITIIQANICRNQYDQLKELDQTIKGIVFLIELTTIKDLTIIRHESN